MFDFSFIFYVVLFLVVLALLKSCIVVTQNKTVKIIETFGKYSHYKTPGISLKWPAPFQVVAKTMPMNIYQLQKVLELKTKDNLFITYPVTVQVKITDPAKAAYELDDPNDQILSYISNLVRSEVGKREFLELYGLRDEIQQEIQESLSEKLKDFGFEIVNVLVDEPEPSEDVRRSYDSVTQSKRSLEAASNNADALKITRVAAAEAEKQARKLYGEGIAEQRTAIAQGFTDSVDTISKDLNISPETAMDYMLTLFKYDTLRDASNNDSTIIITDTTANTELTKNLASFAALKEKTDKENKTAVDLNK